jgi:hypothetical protein
MLNFTFDKRINMDQATNSILMIRPINFGYNEETAGDNHYQNKDSIIKNSNETAQKEFDNMVKNLKKMVFLFMYFRMMKTIIHQIQFFQIIGFPFIKMEM